MDQTQETTPRVHKGWPKGKPRKPRIEAVPASAEDQAPIHVRVRLKGMDPFEFGCSQHTVEGGFHVFMYPSLRDRYRQTRREIAVSEVIDIEITAAFDFTRQPVLPATPPRILPAPSEIHVPREDGRPVIHSARQDAMARIQQRLEEPVGPEKIESIPGITLGGSDV